jgi:hypothetical protein
MELVRTLEENSISCSKWGIYKLDEKESEKYGGKFALSQGIFLDCAIENMGSDELLSELRDFRYEGFFQTEKEAYFQAVIVFMQSKIERLERGVRELFESMEEMKTPEWHEIGGQQ